jgi:hypothetical protein
MTPRDPLKREIVCADKTPNKRYHDQIGYVLRELIDVEGGELYAEVIWLTKPSVTGDKRQIMTREHLTTIGYDNPHNIILEEDEPECLMP